MSSKERSRATAGPLERLRKVLALERQRKFADTAVVGGLDRFLLNFSREAALGESHRFTQVLRSLPYGGYRALHPVQRKTVVEELEKAVSNGVITSISPPPRPVEPPANVIPFKARPAPAKPKVTTVGTLNSSVTVLKGVSAATQAKFAKVGRGIHTVRDLLLHQPREYLEYAGVVPISKLEPGKVQTIIGTIFASGKRVAGRARNKQNTEAFVNDDSGSVRVVWWNQPWVANKIHQGQHVALTGKASVYGGRLELSSPEFENAADPALRQPRIIPVYPATEKLNQGTIRDAVRQSVENFAPKFEETLPEPLRDGLDLPDAPEAIRMMHLPSTLDEAAAGLRRLAFEELMYVELGVVKRRREWQAAGGAQKLSLGAEALEGFVKSLPWGLTGDQGKAVRDILADIDRDVPMNRLLEGDVGTGKTVVAGIALLAAVSSGYQGAIMAPTEILAEQLYSTFCKLIDPRFREQRVDDLAFEETGAGFRVLRPPSLGRELRIALLRGSQKAAEKNAVQDAIAAGEVDIAVGTHALIQGGVSYDRLALIVVDEQHRFGVEQRAALREKGITPHVLVMTATPIPRTMMLTVYGDLDATVVAEMPDDRPPVKTMRISDRQRDQAYTFVRRKVAEGRQAYVICPLVEESEVIAAKSAVAEYERLSRDIFPDLRLGLLHGRMPPAEKDATMRRFRDGELDVLVSTAVVEVGVDVPNATVILIEGADRFGLAQLHQFRGRVRRTTMQAYCLLTTENASPETSERLAILETTSDGFALAEHDLRLRGPGEYFGVRQSGLPDLRFAKLTDQPLIELARKEATRLLDADAELARPDHAGLKAGMESLWSRVTAETS